MKIGIWILNIIMGVGFFGLQVYTSNLWDPLMWLITFLNIGIGMINYYYSVYLKEKEEKKQKTLDDYSGVP